MEHKWAAGHTLGDWKWRSFCSVCKQKYKHTVRVIGVKSFGTWTLNKGWQKKCFVCSICIKYHWKTESLSVSLSIQTLRDIFHRSSMFCREIWIASRNRSKREMCGGHEWMLQPPPTLWNTGFLWHNLPPCSEIRSSYYTLASKNCTCALLFYSHRSHKLVGTISISLQKSES